MHCECTCICVQVYTVFECREDVALSTLLCVQYVSYIGYFSAFKTHSYVIPTVNR